MTKPQKTKAAALAAIGGTCAFVGIVLGGPIFGIPAIILGVKALKSMTPEEKAMGLEGPKDQAWTAIIGGILSFGWPVAIVYFEIVHH